jgi:hypothetical protein
MIIYKLLRNVPRSEKQDLLQIFLAEKRRMRREEDDSGWVTWYGPRSALTGTGKSRS